MGDAISRKSYMKDHQECSFMPLSNFHQPVEKTEIQERKQGSHFAALDISISTLRFRHEVFMTRKRPANLRRDVIPRLAKSALH
jgi:hypothetical protein